MRTVGVVLAAGESTRMKSRIPKIFHEVAGVPIISRVLDAMAGGVDQLVAVLGRDFDAAARWFTDHHPEVTLVHQRERLGTGHAVQQAVSVLDGDADSVLVVPGDLPLLTFQALQPALDRFARNHPACVVLTFQPDDPSGYGRVISQADRFQRIVEERDADEAERAVREVNSGVYVFNRASLATYLARIDNHNQQQEYYLTDVPGLMAADGLDVQVERTSRSQDLLGVNHREQLAKADRIAVQRVLRRWMREGVTILMPETVRIEASVTLEPDVTVYPGVQISGHCHIERDTVIETGSVIRDSRIGRECRILPYSVMTHAVIGNRCSVGPMAHLRPGTTLAEDVKVGNFVETKKATLHEGVKASHLSYLGDADIGAHTNIGAGTITCNYDGIHKHPTTIGTHAFIGSDSQLVAPVKVGDHAYVGAGSTITRDVPDWSLAISRARQTIIENWARRKKKKDE